MNYVSPLLVRVAEHGKSSVAFYELDSGAGITRDELLARVSNLAGHLAERGVTPGTRVVLHLYNSIDAIVAHMAVQYLGAVSCFVDALVQPKSLAHYVGATGCRVMITHCDPASIAPGVLAATDLLTASQLAPLSLTLPPSPCPATAHAFATDEPSYVYFTSGTTSVPKGVVLAPGNHAAFTAICDRYWRPVEHDSRHLCFVPFSHGFGTIFLVPLALRTGSTLFIMRAFHPLKVLEAVERHGITHLYGVPSHYQQLLRMGSATASLKSLRMAFCAAAKLEHTLMLDWQKATGVLLCEGYGLIETCCGVTWRVGTPSQGTGHMGPCPDRDLVEIGILDDHDQLLPADVTGQIAIKGPSVMQGYLGDQAATRSVMVDGWFKTGDEGYVSAGNQLFLTGRIKDIINIAGIKVSPFEVEAVLDQHPAVAQSAVVAASDPLYGEVVKAFVQLRPGHALTERELIRFAGPQLINFQVPKTITFVESFPLTNMGKLDRKQLRHRS
jgi:long-chain acyl-CoA synthetase